MDNPLLEVQNLQVHFINKDKVLRANDDLSYTVHQGECVALIGESGSGKSVSALSILRLIPYPPGLIVGGKILFHGRDLLEYSDKEMERLRGNQISMIFQEPMTSLNPVMTIGDQIAENLIYHRDMTKREAFEEAARLLSRMDIPRPEERLKDYPFQFSGGMQQRVMIAMAMSCRPEILIADEPTTALDVTVQMQVLEQLDALRKENNMALIIITHNLGLVARYADSVMIVYGGRIVESGRTRDVYKHPAHPYTIGLLRAVPRLDRPRSVSLSTIEGEPPDMSVLPPECCPFYDRCRFADEICRCQRPSDASVEGDGHICACHHIDIVAAHAEEMLA